MIGEDPKFLRLIVQQFSNQTGANSFVAFPQNPNKTRCCI
jgi:hypothetical protein